MVQDLPVAQQVGVLASLAFKNSFQSYGNDSCKHQSRGTHPHSPDVELQNNPASVYPRMQVVPRYPHADSNTEEKMAISKDPFSEELASISDRGISPETLAKSKDGSTFAAKARAAELNATRARKLLAKDAQILNENDDNDVPPFSPVPLGLFTFRVTTENKLKSPSPQHHSLRLPQHSPLPLQDIAHQYLDDSISCLRPLPVASTSSKGWGKASISSTSTRKSEVILDLSQYDHHKTPRLSPQHPEQLTSCLLSPRVATTSETGGGKALIPSPSIPKHRQSQVILYSSRQEHQKGSRLPPQHLDQSIFYLHSPRVPATSNPSSQKASVSSLSTENNRQSEAILNCPRRDIPHQTLPADMNPYVPLGQYATVESVMLERARRAALQQQNIVPNSPFDASWQRQHPLHGLRDPKTFSNMDQATNTLRTVAHDSLARLPTASNPTFTSTKSTLKPEAPVYTPKSKAEKTTKPMSDEAVASLLRQRKRQTPEDSAKWFRTKTVPRDREAIRKLLERQGKTVAGSLTRDRQGKTMAGSLTRDSLPDNDKSNNSPSHDLPKPIGFGRPSNIRAAPNTPSLISSRHENLDSKAASDIMATILANLLEHENPSPDDYFIRYRNAYAFEVDQGPDASKSFFNKGWGNPPARVARDPRRMHQGGSGGIANAFGRR